MGDVQIAVTTMLWQAVGLLLAPGIALLLFLPVAWADEQQWIEAWLERRQRRVR